MSTTQQERWLLGLDVGAANGDTVRQLVLVDSDPTAAFTQAIERAEQADKGEYVRVVLYQPSQVPTAGWLELAYHVVGGEDGRLPEAEDQPEEEDPSLPPDPAAVLMAEAEVRSALMHGVGGVLNGLAGVAHSLADAAWVHGRG